MKTAEEILGTTFTGELNNKLYRQVINAMEEYASQFRSEQQESEWIPVDIAIPAKNGKVKAYDNDSLTPEKELIFEDGKFFYEAHGQKLDYTNHITKWQALPKPPKT